MLESCLINNNMFRHLFVQQMRDAMFYDVYRMLDLMLVTVLHPTSDPNPKTRKYETHMFHSAGYLIYFKEILPSTSRP